MKRTIAERIHTYLQGPDGQQFVHGKWKFWFVAVAFLAVINSLLTWLIFRDDGENYSGPIMLSVGALVAWLCVGALHYSDSPDRALSRGVSALDSVALLFVVAHFAGLLYVYGHHRTLQSAEAEYRAQVERYNEKADKLSTDNVEIARAAQAIAAETTKAERLRNDAAYQLRKAAEAGARGLPRSASTPAVAPGSGLTTSAVEIERPIRPDETSAAFLNKWDGWIRAANFGELLLCALTLIFIRNQSARTNSPPVIYDNAEAFPHGLVALATAPSSRGNFTRKKDTAKTHASSNFEGLKILRAALRDISFRLHKYSFKVDIRGDAVWIRIVYARQGTQETKHSVRAKLSLLDDAVTMPREQFVERLTKFLRQNGFEL